MPYVWIDPKHMPDKEPDDWGCLVAIGIAAIIATIILIVYIGGGLTG